MLLHNMNECTGCMLCVKICPIKCIDVKINDEGFQYPYNNEEKCKKCGACENACPNNKNLWNNKVIKVYATQRRAEELLVKSSSGGMGALLSEYVINNGGVVYGAVYENMHVVHKKITLNEEIGELYGSKYVQSDIMPVYEDIKEECVKDKLVLVIGTPCQVAAIKEYIGNNVNLILVDLVCHGVPSPILFENYIKWKEQKINDGRIVSFKFRDKKISNWSEMFKASIITNGKVENVLATRDPYYSAFLYSETYRKSCYSCKYAKTQRVGDITIGDYWGIGDYHKEINFDISKGVSLVLVNNQKGLKVFNEIKDDLHTCESTIERAKKQNPNLYKPSEMPRIRSKYYNCIDQKGYQWAYTHMFFTKQYYINFIKSIIP